MQTCNTSAATWRNRLQSIAFQEIAVAGQYASLYSRAFSMAKGGRILEVAYAELASAIGRSSDFVSDGLRHLERVGWITVVRRPGRPHQIVFTDLAEIYPETWAAICQQRAQEATHLLDQPGEVTPPPAGFREVVDKPLAGRRGVIEPQAEQPGVAKPASHCDLRALTHGHQDVVHNPPPASMGPLPSHTLPSPVKHINNNSLSLRARAREDHPPDTVSDEALEVATIIADGLQDSFRIALRPGWRDQLALIVEDLADRSKRPYYDLLDAYSYAISRKPDLWVSRLANNPGRFFAEILADFSAKEAAEAARHRRNHTRISA